MKKKRRLSFQLFIATFSIMAVIFALIMFLQYLFFDDFYRNYKRNKISKEITELAEIIEEGNLGYVDIMALQDEFLLYKNTYLSITDEYGREYSDKLLNEQQWYTVNAVTTDGDDVVFTISEYELYLNLSTVYGFDDWMENSQLEVGNSYTVAYDAMENNEIYVYAIWEHVDEYFLEEYIPSLQVEITNIKSAAENEINRRINYIYIFGSTVGNEIIVYDNAVTDEDVLIVEGAAYDDNGDPVIINAIISLENVDDAAAALLSYYPCFLVFSALGALIISYIYSNRVSKPIIEMSRISDNMAKLDFGEKVKAKKKNEIGVLGNNMNTMADNLQQSLEELKNVNAKLLKDIELKKQQEQARKDFVANISHELKTPLGIIRCNTESLKDNIIDRPKDEYYDDIISETNKLTRMVMEMLELSKAESGDLKLDKEHIDIRGMIEDTIVMHKAEADAKSMNFVIDGDFHLLYADVKSMDSVLSNIILNAIRHGDESSDIRIIGEVNKSQYRVNISNKCSGINDTETDNFFNRFYVGDKSRHDSSTGLGLSICEAVFKAHGFKYGINSRDNIVTVWFEDGM